MKSENPWHNSGADIRISSKHCKIQIAMEVDEDWHHLFKYIEYFVNVITSVFEEAGYEETKVRIAREAANYYRPLIIDIPKTLDDMWKLIQNARITVDIAKRKCNVGGGLAYSATSGVNGLKET